MVVYSFGIDPLVPEGETFTTIPWEAVVAVGETPELERELVARMGPASAPRSVGVTDLISLRRGFYRMLGPVVPIPPARQARLDQGRALHRAIGARLAREGTLEARARRDGLVGRIDILADLPVEVKTSASLVAPSELTTARPDHIEQLGMYCALVGRPTGQLLTIVPGPTGVSEVQAVEVSFRSTERIRSEMERRAQLLRIAWAEARPDPLPRCPWYGRGCEFQEAGVCACTGLEEEAPASIAEEIESISPREEVRERVRSALSEPTLTETGAGIERFRDILYPRRAYFDRTASTFPAPPLPTAAPLATLPPEKDLYTRLVEALESGAVGEVARLPPRSVEPEEEVVGFRGRPFLLRTSRAWARFRTEELVPRAPQYALELGLRCAVTGTDSGLVVMGFERAETDRDRLQVLEVRFDSLTPFSRLYRERSRGLAEAIRDQTPEWLPPCLGWMTATCPYRPECDCETASSPRVTR